MNKIVFEILFIGILHFAIKFFS